MPKPGSGPTVNARVVQLSTIADQSPGRSSIPKSEVKTLTWRLPAENLYRRGVVRMLSFCRANNVPVPKMTVVPRADWHVSACAYYRADTDARRKYGNPGINVCLPLCQTPAPVAECRNWSWPGSVTDRTPYGVIAHELAHHCDWFAGEKKWEYGSEYSEEVMTASGEKPLTSYCDNPAEWFAEIMRLFITNPKLLAMIRPYSHRLLLDRWKPVGGDWRAELRDAPDRIFRTLKNKGAK